MAKFGISFFFISFLCVFVCKTSIAQVDTSLIFVRHGQHAIIELKKFKTLSQLKKPTGLDLPVYSFSVKQLVRVKYIIDTYIKMESDYESLKKEEIKKDSIYNVKFAMFSEMDSLQRMRSANYELAYNALLKVNAELDEQLQLCEKMALKEHSRRKLNSALFGIAGGLSAIIIIGIILK